MSKLQSGDNAESVKRKKDSLRKANEKYLQGFEMISFRMKKGEKERLKEHAAMMGESLNQFMIRAVNDRIKLDTLKKNREGH